MKYVILSILAAVVFVFSACQSYIPTIESNQSVKEAEQETEMPKQFEQSPTSSPELTSTSKPSPTLIVIGTTEPTEKPTAAPTAKPTEKPTVATTEKPTNPPTPEPTVMPTPIPTVQPTEEPEIRNNSGKFVLHQCFNGRD